VSDRIVEAARAIVDDGLDDLFRQLDGLDDAQLDARPGGPATNPLAVISMHALASTRSWLALATGAPLPPRDRPAEFRAVAGAAWASGIAALAEDCRALLGEEVTFDPSLVGTAPWRTGAPDEPVAAPWALLKAVTHLGEHLGHAHLTRELLDRG
jgi:hypothetical protein